MSKSNYHTTLSKLKCLGRFSIHDKQTVKFVNPMYRGKQETVNSEKVNNRNVISIPATLYIVY